MKLLCTNKANLQVHWKKGLLSGVKKSELGDAQRIACVCCNKFP